MLPLFQVPQASDLYNLPCSLLARTVVNLSIMVDRFLVGR